MNQSKLKLLDKIKPRTLFLIDGLGALLSAFMLGVVLVKFESTFGMPRNILYILAIIPIAFTIYSFTLYFRFPTHWRTFLKGIAFANLAYCCLTFIFMIIMNQKLSLFGFLYFIFEIIIILVLVYVELKSAQHSKETQ